MKRHSGFFQVVIFVFFAHFLIFAQTPPKTFLGFEPGDDRKLADWGQIVGYFKKLDSESPRVKVSEIGKTTLGRPMIAVFISSPQNIQNLEKYRQISSRLADPRTISSELEAKRLIESGKTIVNISCSIHSTEIVASQMSMALAYELASSTTAETQEILNNTILILLPSSNPDGIDIVADWYRKTLGTKSEGTAPPELYHHYAGHDDNRDWFMLNLAETREITKLFWQQWFPQIVYDVHQMGQVGPRFVIPPFFDPPNPRMPPLILREVGLIGYKMAADLSAAGVKGVATNTTFDTWWHGGFRSAPYYHNSIGILSEAASADLMTPVEIKPEQLQRARPARGLNSPLEFNTAQPEPWTGGRWSPRDIVNIEMIASKSLLTMAAKFRQRYLENFYNLGKAALRPDENIPEAFIIPAGQPNSEFIARFVDILRWQGIEVHRLQHEQWVKMSPKEEFHEVPAGSLLVFTNQPQRPNILSLFERQIYPNRVGPTGEPDPPYDVAGWTLPLQMGIETLSAWKIKDIENKDNGIKKIASSDEVRELLNLAPAGKPFPKLSNPIKSNVRVALFRGFVPSMDEGWTRWVFDEFQIPYKSLSRDDVKQGRINADVVILPADSEEQIVRGLSSERYPAEFAGGIGNEGIENLKKFVSNGGRLICLDDSCGLVIKHFSLPIKNVLASVRRNEFYNPGSIVKITVNKGSGLTQNVPEELPAYFINSSAFEAVESENLQIVARYAERDALLSGWMLGEKHINSKAAIIYAKYGKGDIVLFAFRPQHRGQSFATFPLFFNALQH
ncbi:MAG TPA: M14 family metallopeptidase [Pyrinomonadaceae bacterium]|nr:M14 family metallopeptidase [Pyrinomonadaceae bacterium]